MPEYRTEKLSIKLTSSTTPVEVSFTPGEFKAILDAMRDTGYYQKATFIKDLVVASARSRISGSGLDTAVLIAEAARDSRLSRPEWIRLIVLGAISFCPLAHYLHAGGEYFEVMKAKVKAV